jgi:hypothetical protein
MASFDRPTCFARIRLRLGEKARVVETDSLPRINGEALPVPVDGDGTFALADFIGDTIPAGTTARAKAFTDGHLAHGHCLAQELSLDLSKAEVDLEHGRVVLRSAGGVERVIG